MALGLDLGEERGGEDVRPFESERAGMSDANPVRTGPHLRHTGIFSNGSDEVSGAAGGRNNWSIMDKHAVTHVNRDTVVVRGVRYDNNFHTRR
jgi:hypothetical protein